MPQRPTSFQSQSNQSKQVRKNLWLWKIWTWLDHLTEAFKITQICEPLRPNMMAQWMRVSLRDVVFAHLRRLRHIVTKLLQVWIKLYFPLTTTELGAPEQNMRKHFHSTHKVKNKSKQLSRFDKLFWTALSSLVFAKHIQTVSKDTSQVFSKGGNNSGIDIMTLWSQSMIQETHETSVALWRVATTVAQAPLALPKTAVAWVKALDTRWQSKPGNITTITTWVE